MRDWKFPEWLKHRGVFPFVFFFRLVCLGKGFWIGVGFFFFFLSWLHSLNNVPACEANMLLFLAKLLDLDKNKPNFLIHLEKKKN